MPVSRTAYLFLLIFSLSLVVRLTEATQTQKPGPLLSVFSNLFKPDSDKVTSKKIYGTDKGKATTKPPAKKSTITKAIIAKSKRDHVKFSTKPNKTSINDNKNKTMYGMYNPNLFQGDILGFDQHNISQYLKEQELALKNRKNSSFLRNAVYPNMLWPDGRIPYVIDQSFDGSYVNDIKQAMAEYARVSCVRFVPRNNEYDYIFVKQSDCACNSQVGRRGGEQTVNISPCNCNFGTIIHELMHAAGFFHEQTRPDRDDHITILFENVVESSKYNFVKELSSVATTLGLPYDYGSIMHYGAYSWSNNQRQTIVPHKNVPIGQCDGFSQLDIQKLNKLYGCSNYESYEKKNKNGNTDEIDEGDENRNMKTKKPRPRNTYCVDKHPKCSWWAHRGECQYNPDWMLWKCKKSCRSC